MKFSDGAMVQEMLSILNLNRVPYFDHAQSSGSKVTIAQGNLDSRKVEGVNVRKF